MGQEILYTLGVMAKWLTSGDKLYTHSTVHQFTPFTSCRVLVYQRCSPDHMTGQLKRHVGRCSLVLRPPSPCRYCTASDRCWGTSGLACETRNTLTRRTRAHGRTRATCFDHRYFDSVPSVSCSVPEELQEQATRCDEGSTKPMGHPTQMGWPYLPGGCTRGLNHR